MTTMRSMNPEAPSFVNATSAAANYANLVNTPRYAVANQFFDDLNKERMANELREEELRRYNQGFALQQAQADRQQALYDRQLNTDKALVDYQNIIHGTAQGGILDNNQGMNLANEYQSLVNDGVAEYKAAETINAKAQMLAQQDAKKAQTNPYYAANKVQGVAINGNRYGDIDPTELINLQRNMVNDLNKQGDSLRDYNLQSSNKNREQLLREQNMNTYIQQMIALGKDPRGYTYEQMEDIVNEASKTKDYGYKDSTLVAKDKELTAKEIAKKETENYDNYTKLMNSKQFINLAEADTFGNKTTEIVDIARQAKIPANIIEGVLAEKSGKNKSKWFEESLKYKDFNKFKVQNPKNKDEWTPLGVWLEELQKQPEYLEQVMSGVSFPNLIQMSQEEIKKQQDANWFIP